MPVYVCGKCGHRTAKVRCRPQQCPECGAPRDQFKKSD
ncbi:MAG: radical SAM protein [Candidatus Coatesbacteria bacterium]|nr:radical SAM protein [Candidatus Coatesbacteria bacterium]